MFTNKKSLPKKVQKFHKKVSPKRFFYFTKHFVWLPLSLPSRNCKAFNWSISLEIVGFREKKKRFHVKKNFVKTFSRKILKFSSGTLCCALRNLNLQTNGKEPFQKALPGLNVIFSWIHVKLYLDYCGRKPNFTNFLSLSCIKRLNPVWKKNTVKK